MGVRGSPNFLNFSAVFATSPTAYRIPSFPLASLHYCRPAFLPASRPFSPLSRTVCPQRRLHIVLGAFQPRLLATPASSQPQVFFCAGHGLFCCQHRFLFNNKFASTSRLSSSRRALHWPCTNLGQLVSDIGHSWHQCT